MAPSTARRASPASPPSSRPQSTRRRLTRRPLNFASRNGRAASRCRPTERASCARTRIEPARQTPVPDRDTRNRRVVAPAGSASSRSEALLCDRRSARQRQTRRPAALSTRLTVSAVHAELPASSTSASAGSAYIVNSRCRKLNASTAPNAKGRLRSIQRSNNKGVARPRCCRASEENCRR